MKKYESAPAYAKMDLRRLWPVVSGTLYPDTIKKVGLTIATITAHETGPFEAYEVLLQALHKINQQLEAHGRVAGDIIKQRLQAFPYGSANFPATFFETACEQQALSSAEIKSTWARIHLLARQCFGKTQSSAQDKLALARLNALEQDIMYLLFTEHEYLCPQILRNIS